MRTKEYFEKIRDIFHDHCTKLYRIIYKEKLFTYVGVEKSELTEEDNWILFQFKICSLILQAFEDTLKEKK